MGGGGGSGVHEPATETDVNIIIMQMDGKQLNNFEWMNLPLRFPSRMNRNGGESAVISHLK